jgi:phage tail sheath protein FI
MRTLHTPGVTFEWHDAALPAIGPLRTDIAGFVGIAQRGPLHKAVKVQSWTQFASVFGGPMPQAYLAYSVDGFFANGGDTCWIVRVADPDLATTATLDIVDGAGTRLLNISAGSPGTWGNGIVATWMYSGTRILSVTLHYPDGTQQLIRNPQDVDVALPPLPNYVRIQRESLPSTLQNPLISLSQPDRVPPSADRAPISAGQALLAGGADGLNTLAPKHFTGQGAPDRTTWGLVALEEARDVSIVTVPDFMPKPHIVPEHTPPPPNDCGIIDQPVTLPQIPQPLPPEYPPTLTPDEILALQQALIGHCEKMHYRVAILDTLDDLTPDCAAAARVNFQYTNHAALYYPWILVDDPLLPGVVRAIPPSGIVAGIYARSDLKYGVHKPPANAIAEGVLDVRTQVDAIIHGELNDANVNVIRSFPGRGIRVYGARTVSTDTTWNFVNVRRLILMIEKAIDQNSQWIVFESNAARLWREMDRIVRAYLESLFRAGMLDGPTSDDAYLVKCDESLNPPETVDAGQVICLLGVQPPYPAEFVVVIVGKTQSALNILQESGATSG